MTDAPGSDDKALPPTEASRASTQPPASVREIPPQERPSTSLDAPDDIAPAVVKPAEQLGFQMRFESGRALLALENKTADVGVDVRRALFEVPDVAFPLDVTGGALKFQNKRLTVRAVELAVSFEALFVVDALRRQGLQLLRERSRAGGLEFLVAVEGTGGPVPVRARCIFAPVGEGGVALVLHEVIGFGPLPRPRLQLAPALLNALAFPGGLPARAMIRRADPFRAVFGRLLPQYGWKVPALGDVRVHEAVLGKGEVVLRAWAGKAPEGWKPAKEQKRGPLDEAIALAVFADSLAAAGDAEAQRRLVDRLADEGALAPAAVPFAAEILRADPRRRADGDDLVARALAQDDEHLALLAAHAEAADIEPRERARRLLRLGVVADAADEPWVAARASLAAARIAWQEHDTNTAIEAAEAAVDADPSVAEAGILLSHLLAEVGDKKRALEVGRAALERSGQGSILEPAADLAAADAFAVRLAAIARDVEGPDAARVLLRRALRQEERADALVAFVELEIDQGALERAAEGLTRLLLVAEKDKGLQVDVQMLAARLAEQKGDRDGARAHLLRAKSLAPHDPRIALRLARLYDDGGDVDRALETLDAVLHDGADERDADVRAALFYAARLLVRRAKREQRPTDAERARALLARLPGPGDAAVTRVDVEARALLGDAAPLARALLADAAAEQDVRAAVALRLEAARYFVDAGEIDAAAHALADTLAVDAGAAGDAIVGDAPAGLASALARGLATALARALLPRAALADDALALARRVAAAGRPADAAALLGGRADRAACELRAAFASDAGDIAGEIAERRALLDLVTDEAQRAALTTRLAVLFERQGDMAAAADAWAETAARGDVDVDAWQRVAVASRDGARLARVLVREDARFADVESSLLRLAIDNVGDGAARRRLLAALAARNDDVGDVERWLDAARELPPIEAALAFVDAARRNRRVDWLLDGVQQLARAGEPARALAAIRSAIDEDDAFAADRAVAERAFSLAIDVDDGDAIEASAARLLARADLEGDLDARSDIHRRRALAHRAHRDDDAREALERRALAAWLDERPTASAALEAMVSRLVARGELDEAVQRLERACAAGAGDDVRALVEATADAARDRGAVAEVRARELLLGFSLDDDLRERTQRRLVDLYVRERRPDRAIALLTDLVERASARDRPDARAVAELWVRIADLEEEERGDKRAAANALSAYLAADPDDATASRRLLALLLELDDDDGIARECLRRAARLPASAERTDLWLRAGDVLRRQSRLDEARAVWLRAVRAPFSPEALERLLALAKETRSRRLAIRARLAAAAALRDEAPRDAVRHAAEAGGLLAGVLQRTRLAIAAFAFSERLAIERGVDDDGSHSRMLVELYRALGDGKNARLRLDRLVERAEGRERARLLEARADVCATLLGDEDGAIADRRAALALDPTFAAPARALVRQLRARGDLLGAIDVERTHADATYSGEIRGITYARLARLADDVQDDGRAALVDELATIALSLREDVDVRRRQVAARELLGDEARLVEALEALLRADLHGDERLARAGRLATLHEARGAVDRAIDVLRDAVDHPACREEAWFAARDQARARLARLLAAHGRPEEAAALVLRALSDEEGAPAFGSRAQALEQAGIWLDDAPGDDSAPRALDALVAAAAAGPLSDDGEARRARLAEELGRPDVAVAALDSLVSRNIEVAHNAARLARAAEAAGDLPRALSAWQLRLSHTGDDLDAWLAVERIASMLGDAAARRRASEELVRREVGTIAQRAARAVACARDAREREGDVTAALAWLQHARALQSTPEVRREALAAAVDAKADDAALSVLDEMHAAGDALSGEDRRRRAALRLAASASADDAAVALDDLVLAVRDDEPDTAPLLALVAERAPAALARALLATALPPLRDALQRVDDVTIPDDDVWALAAKHPADVALARAAARREAGAGRPADAADRLLRLAALRREQSNDDTSSNVETKNLVEQAAALAIDAGGQALIARLEPLRDALREHRGLRDAALATLRDIEAWPQVAVLLEDAVASDSAGGSDAERRALRLQLVSVLRDGVDTPEAEARAAAHLESLVDEDVNDREAWGELFECLDRLGDKDRLQAALGRRADYADGIERRELVRRRLELLLALGRGAEGLAVLQEIRAGDDGEALKDLERRVHVAIDASADPPYPSGGPALARFLDQELARHPIAADAAALLALPRGAVDPSARVRAHVALLTLRGVDDAQARAQEILRVPAATADRVAEAVAVAAATARVAPDSARVLVAALAAHAHHLGSAAALSLSDRLFALDDDVVAVLGDSVVAAFGIPAAARRWRTAGVRAVGADLPRLDGRRRAAVAFRRAARLGDRATLQATAAELGDAIVRALGADGGTMRAELTERARARLVEQARSVDGDLALLRHGDARGVTRVGLRPPSTQGSIARRARATPPSAGRLDGRLALAPLLGEGAAPELARIADAAEAQGRTALLARALDELFARTPPSTRDLVRRADAAVALGAADVAAWCSRAADACGVDERDDAVRLRKIAIAARLRSGDLDALGGDLIALARAAPPGADGDALRNEAVSTAEAARLGAVVDAIMADAAMQLGSVEDRIAAIRRRAALKLDARDPASAFAILLDGSHRHADHPAAAALRAEAWEIAAGNALVDQMLEVVDDDLARAGLLAALGKRAAAVELATRIDADGGSPAALWLIADCARLDGDIAAEERALSTLADRRLADESLLLRLVDAARRRGDNEDAARRGLALLAQGSPTRARVKLVVDCLQSDAVPSALRTEGARALLALSEGAAASAWTAADGDFCLGAVVDIARGAGDPGLLRDARLVLARRRDDDDFWAETLAEMATDVAALLPSLRPLLNRRRVIARLLELAVADPAVHVVAAALRELVKGGEAARVVDVLAGVTALPWPIAETLASALEVVGKPRDAADVLVAVLARPTPGMPTRALRLRASALYVDSGAPGAAARLLQTMPVDDVDDTVVTHASDLIVRAAREGAMGDAALLAAHMARASGNDGFIVRAMGMADAAGGDVALHVARWRLAERDVRAIPLLAHHALEQSPTQGFFGAWHALRSGVRQFAPHAPADFHRIAALKDTPAPSPPPTTSLLHRARIGRRADRQRAWRSLAAELAPRDEIGTARLLARAGVPLSEAPLEVRLAVDPALVEPTARASAIVRGLADVSAARRDAVVAAFDELTAQGATTATQRRAVDAIAGRARDPLLAAIDAAAVGEAVDVKALLQALGRRPSPAARATTAALLASLGQERLAIAVDPAVAARPRPPVHDTLRALRNDVADVDDVTAASRLLLSQLAGPRSDVEERITELGERLGDTRLVADSLARQARLCSDPDERARILLRRAEVLLPKSARAAWRSADAAHRLRPSEQSAKVLARVAEVLDDPARAERALAAWQDVATTDADRVDAALRRARLLSRRMLRPEDAIVVLDDAAASTPQKALFLEKAAIAEELLADPRSAGMAILTAVDLATDLDAADRAPLFRRAAALLEKDGAPTSTELAISALCEAFEAGDADALTQAERLARARDPGAGLARVLDLRLRETDDVAARRVLVLERARLLHDLDDKMGAIALLEAQAVADEIDLGARLALAEWYLADRRILDAALAYESAARIPGLPPAGYGPPAREAGALLAALGDLERAGPLADMAVAAGVTDLEVLSVAEAWHRAHERWAAVDDLLGKELSHIDDPRREAHLWMERAAIRRDRLADENGARKALARVLELVPDHPRALQMMREEAARADTWGALRAALERASAATTDRREQARLLREIAAIDADHLGDTLAAQTMIDRALAIDGDDADTLVQKAAIMVRAGQVDGLAAIMERIERVGGTQQELPGLLHLVRGDALLVAGDRAGARAAFERATEDPETSAKAWDRLIDMCDGTAEAVPLLEEARRATLDTRRRISLTRKEARLRARLGDEDGAVAASELLLQLQPGDTDALALVRDALTRRRKLRELLPYLLGWARAVDANTDAPERARRLAEVGTFALDELGQEGTARDLFEESLGLQADQPQALIRLADIAWASRDDERALQLLDRIGAEQWTAQPDDRGRPRALSELLFRRARCAYALGSGDVRERLRQVLRVDANHAPALDMLARVALEQKDDDAAEMALESLSRAIPQRDDPVRLAGVLIDLAQLRQRRGKVDEALTAAEKAFELNPTALPVLEVVAAAREEAGKMSDAAEAWRRIAAVNSGGERRRALERRAHCLATAGRTKDAVDAWLELFADSGDARHRAEAQELARRSGNADLIARTGAGTSATATLKVEAVEREEPVERTESMAMAAGPGAGALVIQLRANLDENDPQQALDIALANKDRGLDEEATRLALVAAERAGRFDAYVEIAEARLGTANDPAEVQRIALAAGRVARDKLHDDNRAAALLYQAHQADAEDVEIRLELTQLYARIPRLATHAVTGILQLLRRTPDDPRVFALAASLAESQGQAERAAAMRAIEGLLRGKGSPADAVPRVEPVAGTIVALDKEAIATRLAPTGWNGPMQQLFATLGVHLEVTLGGPTAPAGAKPLAQASPKSLALAERADRLLPGRVAQLLIADVERSYVAAGGVPQIVLPRDLLAHECALLAAIARGLAVVRLNALAAESLRPGEEDGVLDLLRAALLGQGPRDARTELLTARLREEDRQTARKLLLQVLEKPDVAGTVQILTRACDRFALVTCGSPVATLAATSLPTLLREPPHRAATSLRGSARALELCAFAARDNTWLIRRQHGLAT